MARDDVPAVEHPAGSFAQAGTDRGAAREDAPRRTWSASSAAVAVSTLLVAALALMTYVNATHAVAIHDDSFFVPARHNLSATSIGQIFTEDMWSSTGSPTGVYRPLVVLSIAANGAMFGSNPLGYHQTNVALHVVASIAVFLLLVELLGPSKVWIAALAGALFAVHPIHTEVVNSVYNRSEMLSTTFVATALFVLHRWHERRAVLAWTAVTILYFLGLLCRESAVSLPALAVLMLWFAHPDEPARKRISRVLPALVLVLPLAEYFMMRSFALSAGVQSSAPRLGADAGQDLASRFLYSVAALREYARMLVWPHPLRVSYEDFAGDGLVAALVVHGALLTSAVALRRRAPLVAFAIAFFYVSLLPSTRLFTSSGATVSIGGFVLLKPQGGLVLVGERVAYLPSVALAIAVAAALAALAERAGLRIAAACAAIVVLAGARATYARNADWRSAPSLFGAEVEAAPQNGDGWRLYVSSLSSAGRLEEAAKACDEQLQKSARSAQLFNNCGVVYDRLGRDELAMQSYQRAVDQGLLSVGHANLGRVYARLGRAAEAEAEFRASIETETNPAQKHYRSGMFLVRFHPEQPAEARKELEAALAIQPDFAAARQALAKLPR